MAVSSIKGLNIWLEKGTHSPVKITPASVANGQNALVTFDSSSSQLENGDIIKVNTSGFTELDGKSFVVGTLDKTTPNAATFKLLGSNITQGTLDTTNVDFEVVHSSDMVKLCLSGVDIAAGTPSTIDISTFCNPGASLPGNPAAGTFTFNGYTDIADAGYQELLIAETDGIQRAIKFDIPNQGYLIGETIIGSVTWNLPLEGSSDYSFSAAMSVPLRHVF